MSTLKPRRVIYLPEEVDDAVQAIAEQAFGLNYTATAEYLIKLGIQQHTQVMVAQAQHVSDAHEELAREVG